MPLSLFLLLFLSLWATRNHSRIAHFYFLTEPGSGYPLYKKETYKSFRNLLNLWGESDEPWNKGAKSSFFFSYRQTEYKGIDFPVNAYCTTDSLLELRKS